MILFVERRGRKEEGIVYSKLTNSLCKSDSLTAGSSERYNGGLQQMEEYRSKNDISHPPWIQRFSRILEDETQDQISPAVRHSCAGDFYISHDTLPKRQLLKSFNSARLS